jgi:hypothetical protein
MTPAFSATQNQKDSSCFTARANDSPRDHLRTLSLPARMRALRSPGAPARAGRQPHRGSRHTPFPDYLQICNFDGPPRSPARESFMLPGREGTWCCGGQKSSDPLSASLTAWARVTSFLRPSSSATISAIFMPRELKRKVRPGYSSSSTPSEEALFTVPSMRSTGALKWR